MKYTKRELATLERAANIIKEKDLSESQSFSASRKAKEFVRLKLAGLESESFFIAFLTSQHGLIAFEEMFRGTIDGAAVYPREIVKAVLKHNAAAVILAHNHPSGIPEPSQADIAITRKIKTALDTIDVRTLDHFIVGNTVVSLAERGLI